MSEGSSTQDVTTAIASGTSSPPDMSEPQEGPSGIGRPPEDWESHTGEELDHTSLSMCVSEASCKKSRGERSQSRLTTYYATSNWFYYYVINITLNPKKHIVLKAELDQFSPLGQFHGHLLFLSDAVCLCSFLSFPPTVSTFPFWTVITAILEESCAKHTLCPDE